MKNKEEDKEKQTAGFDMGFLNHIDELRRRIIWSIIALLVACVITAFFIEPLLEHLILEPSIKVDLTLQNLSPFGQPLLYFKLILIIGLIISFPFMLFQLWKFIAPGLYVSEKQWVGKITFATSFCFLLGIAFAYFLMIPVMLDFAAGFGTEKINNIIDVNKYLSFITTILLSLGLLFELPMVAYVLARFGVITPDLMKKYRRHGILIIFILSAALTPTTDPINMMIFAAPLLILYEISIMIAKLARRQYLRALKRKDID